MNKHERPFFLIIAGPTGVGKTTLSRMLSRYYNGVYLSEDEIAKEIFPDEYKIIEDYPDKVEIIARELFNRAKENFNSGKCVVMDWINLEKEAIEEIKKALHHNLILKVLWPPIKTTIERDRKREGWASGENTIKRFYRKYEELEPVIGAENYIDNSHQTPEETFEGFIAYVEGM